MKPNGYVIYEGPSLLDGEPIVVVATGFRNSSSNVKTGSQIQTWIMRADMNPVEAAEFGDDESVCGGCVHRGHGDRKRSCYVLLFQAPLAIWEAYKRGAYPVTRDFSIFAGRVTRLGSYGDPAAVPNSIWNQIVSQSENWTGYTHQWADFDELPFLMASVDSLEEKSTANARGFRTFRVMRAGDTLSQDEILCPASKEGGFKTTCNKCCLCQGSEKQARNIAIYAHGNGKAHIS